MVDETVVCQGAEGIVYEVSVFGKQSVCKERLCKTYRLQELDAKINKQRLIHESRCLAKCIKAGVAVPSIYFVDVVKNRLYMEKVEGPTIKNFLWNSATAFEPVLSSSILSLEQLAARIGIIIAKMHDENIVHGDLTTSNMILRAKDMAVVLIDFGLGSMKPTSEDKAVDLYVLERAFVSTHAGSEEMVAQILSSYQQASKLGKAVLAKLEQVLQLNDCVPIASTNINVVGASTRSQERHDRLTWMFSLHIKLLISTTQNLHLDLPFLCSRPNSNA